MNMKTYRRQRSLKTKLMAAICMLLVSSLMMVTTTYAWFTLSTAPEVTGITTAVGANGNLEMALLNPELQDLTAANKPMRVNWADLIESGTNDSMDAAGQLMSDANITWGNLVDVSDTITYGLNNITLYPSQLSTTADGKISATPLSRPVFGADGRIAELKADTLTASFASGTFSNEGALGVRAVGTASSMTARELAHRAALNAAANASTAAKTTASGTLNTHGNALAAMAITHVANDAATFTNAQVEVLRTVVNALGASHAKIREAINWYVVAHNIAPNTQTDATYQALQTQIQGLTLEEIETEAAEENATITVPANFTAVLDALQASEANVTSALNTLKTALDETYAQGTENYNEIPWGGFSGALEYIMDYNKLKLNGLTMQQVMETEETADGTVKYKNMSVIVSAMGVGGLKLQMPTTSGVFADIADFCGTYSARIVFSDDAVVMGVPLGGVPATMTTDEPRNSQWLDAMRTATNPFAAAEGATETKSITDFYGYIIDLAFRTNASGSSLLLQADAIDRIYGEDGNNVDTMGHGSSMTFTASEAFGVTKVQDLMGSLRIVFFETDTSAIIGYARLNPDSVAIDGNAVTMKMGMWDEAAGAFKTGTNAEARAITELAQNEAKAISVLVYLDGTSVTNADVAATGTQSMVGTMNLQFASSATLVPMEYADLKDGKSESDATQTITLTAVTVDTATQQKGISVIRAVSTTIGTQKGFGVILNKALADGETITATIDGETVTGVSAAVNGLTGYVFEYNGNLAADTAITISVASGSATPPVTPNETVDVTFNNAAAADVTSSGVATATKGTAYTFTLSGFDVAANNYTVTYTVGASGSPVTLAVPDAATEEYSIDGAAITDAITITVTATPIGNS